jgi:hypothetical protein
MVEMLDNKGNLEKGIYTRKELVDFVEKAKYATKAWAVDVGTGTVVYTPISAVNEYFIAGMEPDEVLASRIGMTLVNSVVGRPYGLFRDFWAEKVMKADGDSSRKKKALADTTSLLAFYMPFYAGVAKFGAGASWEEVGTAIGSGSIMLAITARPYGIVLDKVRKKFGVKTALEKKVE